MRRAIIFAMFFLLYFDAASAQEKVLVIYADASSVTNQFSLSNKLFDAIQDTDHKLILYISNGNKPFVCSSINEAKQMIDKLYQLKANAPDPIFDIDSLNKILWRDSILFDVSNRSNELNEYIHFYFFLNAKQCRIYKQDQRIAKTLLLSNRVINKNGLLYGCKAKLFIQNCSSAADSAYFNKIEESSIFEVKRY